MEKALKICYTLAVLLVIALLVYAIVYVAEKNPPSRNVDAEWRAPNAPPPREQTGLTVTAPDDWVTPTKVPLGGSYHDHLNSHEHDH